MRKLGWIIGAGCGLLAIYVGTYFGTVQRDPIPFHYPRFMIKAMGIPPNEIPLYRPKYRFGGQISEGIFAPIHAIDKKMRTAYWVVEPYYGE